jgi:Ca2+/H+ antiporter, TMEM165/GDT1 family
MLRIALSTFVFIFLAELGDKTQIAVFSLSSESSSPWPVFIGASTALVLSTALAVVLGTVFARSIPPGFSRVVHYVAGGLLVLTGAWMIWKA